MDANPGPERQTPSSHPRAGSMQMDPDRTAQLDPDRTVQMSHFDPDEAPSDEDRYDLRELLGKGGMGLVHRAYDRRLERFVALKFLREPDPQQARRLLREARAQARIEHDHVCKIYEVGTAGGRQYISMQLIEGETLHSARQRMTLEQRLQLMEQVCDAVHAAHRSGLIHRDLKPGNILVEQAEDGSWRPHVTDFGLAGEVQADAGMMTEGISGTPRYMAPEQALGEVHRLDRRTDVYSLGVTLYELICGSTPFEGRSSADLLLKSVSQEPTPLRQRDPSVPRDLQTIVMKCLEREPQRRYDSARALGEDLRRYLHDEPIAARPVGTLGRLWRLARRHKAVVAVAALGLALATVFAAMALEARSSAAHQARMAERFGQEVERIDGLLRVAQMAPRHDLRPERALVRRRLARIQLEMQSEGRAAAGPGEAALGRGELALGRPLEARRRLDAAWAAGYRTPEVAYALGVALAELYRRGQLEVSRIRNPAAREEQLRKLDAEFRDPALQALRAVKERPALEAPELAQALLAFHQKQYARALELAKAAERHAPWLYEVHKLEGDVHMMMAVESMASSPEDSQRSADEAGKAYAVAAEIARSAAGVHEADCRRWFWQLEALRNRGKPVSEAFESGKQACGRALEIDPESADALWTLGRLYFRRATESFDQGSDPTAPLQRAAELMAEAVRWDPTSARILTDRSSALLMRADWEVSHGLDPQKSLEEAISVLDKALELDPQMASTHSNLATASALLGDHLASRGQDPRPALDRSIQSLEHALLLQPDAGWIAGNLGEVLLRRARAEIVRGGDPGPLLDRAVQQLAPAVKRHRAIPELHERLGEVHLVRAEHQHRLGKDASQALEQARSVFRAGLDVNPRSAFAHKGVGQCWLLQARIESERGADSTASIVSAVNAFQQALEIRARTSGPHQEIAVALTLLARYQLSRGLDPQPTLQQALDEHALALQAPGAGADAHEMLGATRTELARALLEAGSDPAPTLQQARAALRQAAGMATHLGSIRRRLGEVSILEGRWATRSAEAADAAWRDAEAELAEARRLGDTGFEVDRAEAELALRHAEDLMLRLLDSGKVLARGLSAADRALAVHPEHAELKQLRSRLAELQQLAGRALVH